jgi:serine/threonine protein kinase
VVPLDGYSYLGSLGQPGYFGEVHLAQNILSGELVAIKHVDGGKLAMSLDAWSAEAQAMAACRHKNLVQIKHAEVTPAGPALVMEYLEDGSWEGRSAGGPGPVVDVVDIGIDLCWDLHHLHGQGLVHRDIKPGNVLLRGDTGILADFGLTGLQGTEPRYQYVPHAPPEARRPPVTWTVEATCMPWA